jgi:hypothetical protein
MRAVAKDLSEMLDMRGKNGAGDSQWDPFAGGYTPPLLDEPYYPPQLGSYDEEDADYEDEDD